MPGLADEGRLTRRREAAVEPETVEIAVEPEELLAAGDNYDAARVLRRMKRLWDVRRVTCRAGGMILSRPRVAKAVTRVAAPFAPLALRLVGK